MYKFISCDNIKYHIYFDLNELGNYWFGFMTYQSLKVIKWQILVTYIHPQIYL